MNSFIVLISQVFLIGFPLAILSHAAKYIDAQYLSNAAIYLSLVALLGGIIDYSFNLSGIKMIVLNNEKNNFELFRIVLGAKIVLFVGVIFGLVTFSLYLPKDMLFQIIISCLGYVLTQNWILIASKDASIFLINIVPRIIILLCFVLQPGLYSKFILVDIFTFSIFICGIFNFLYFFKKYKIRMSKLILDKTSVLEIKNNFSTFSFMYLGIVFTNISPLILSYAVNANQLINYVLIERLYRGILAVYLPISNIIFPKNILEFSKSLKIGLKNTIPQRIIILSSFIFFETILYINLKNIGMIVGFTVSNEMKFIAILLSFWCIGSILNNLLGIQTLILIGDEKFYSISFIFSVVILVFLQLYLGFELGILGIPISFLIVEFSLLIILSSRIYYLFQANK